MVALNFNPSQHEPSAGGSGPIVAEGWYDVTITKSVMKQTAKKPQNLYLEVTMHCVALQRDLTGRFNLVNDNPQAVSIANGQFSLLCHVLGLTSDIGDSQALHNKPFQVFAAVEETTDEKNVKRTQNRFENFRYSNGAEFAKNPGNAPHGAAPAQNPAAPPGYGAPASPPPPAQQPYAPPGQPPAYAPPQGPAPAQPWGGGPPPGQPPQPGYAPQPGQPPAYAPPGQPPAYAPPQGQPPAYAPPQGQPPAYAPLGQPPGYPPQGGAAPQYAPQPGAPPAWSGPPA